MIYCYTHKPQPGCQNKQISKPWGQEGASTECSEQWELKRGWVALRAKDHSTIKGCEGEGIKPVTPLLS